MKYDLQYKMWLYTFTALIVCLQIQDARTEPVSVNVAATATVSASTTLHYGQTSFSPENVIDGNNQTTPDACNCCWSSVNEPAPHITLLLPQRYLVTSIEIIGRSDHIDAPRILTGVNIAVDGVDMTHDQHLVGNDIHLDVTQSVSNITVTRPRPTGQTEWYLIICEIKVYSLGEDIIDKVGQSNVHVNQSSIYNNNRTYYGPQNAIDGTGTVKLHSCPCCSVTNNVGQDSWWQVDLKRQYLVWVIQIFGRAPDVNSDYNEQLQGAVVYAGNTSLTQDQHQGVTIYTVTTMSRTTRHFTQILKEAITSQYFLMELNKPVLSLCEFKIFQKVCDIGHFGFGCSHVCHCYDNQTCNSTTGECQTPGCSPGWSGVACNQACHKGKYGKDCSYSCSAHCYDDCNKFSGICDQGCNAGYKGPYCNTTCDQGHYGRNCSMTCSEHCMEGVQNCDTINGTCTAGCKAGYTGDTCEQACRSGYYGDGCSGRCHCKDGVDCLKNNGTCPDGCEFGWEGDGCSIDMSINTKNNPNVSTNQSSTFKMNKSAFGPQNAIDGVDNYDVDHCGCCSVTADPAPGHNSWWQIDLGQQYLVKALQIYGRSSGNEGQLQGAIIYAGNTSLIKNQDARMKIYTVPTMTDITRHFTKTLDNAIISQFFIVELSGSLLTLCEFKLFEQVCGVGQFGFGCSHICHCSDNQTCGSVTGTCQTPGCYVGWNGTSCDQECVTPAFGVDCGSTCHCINGSHCDSVTGHCDLGQCDPGWKGGSCSKACDVGMFGYNCSRECHCADNLPCNGKTGECQTPGCHPGWNGTSCEHVCGFGNFGFACSHVCHCNDNHTCNSVTGTCQTPGCRPGWNGSACDQVDEILRYTIDDLFAQDVKPMNVG